MRRPGAFDGATFAEWVLSRRGPVLSFIVIVTTIFAVGLGRLDTATSADAFIERGSTIHEQYDRFRADFGDDDVTSIVIEVDDPFAADSLARLRDLHARLIEVPHVGTVNSLVNVPDLSDPSGFAPLIGDGALDDPDVRRRIVDSPVATFFYGLGDSPYLVLTLTLVTVDGGGVPLETAEVNHALGIVEDIIDDTSVGGFRPVATGTNLYALRSAQLVSLWTGIGTVALLAGILAALFVVFRSRAAVLLPMLVLVVTLIWTLGLMAWLGVSLNPLSQVLIMVLIAASAADAIHIVHRCGVIAALERHTPATLAIAAVGEKAWAVVMTSVSTAIAFSTFALVAIDPIRELGVFGAFGILAAMLNTLLLAPILVARFGVGPSTKTLGRVGSLAARLAARAVRRARPVLVATVALLLVAVLGASMVKVEFSGTRFAVGGEVEDELDRVQDLTGVGAVIDVVYRVDTGMVLEPEAVSRLRLLADEISDWVILDHPVVTFPSLIDIADNAPQGMSVEMALAGAEAAGLVTPGSLVSHDQTSARLRLGIRLGDMLTALDDADSQLARLHGDLHGGEHLEIDGSYRAIAESARRALPIGVLSFGVALAVVFLVLCVALRSVVMGVVAMLPNVLPPLAVLALMGFAGVPLDLITIVVLGIVVGLAVDDTIHIAHALFVDQHRTGEFERDLERAMRRTGAALVLTSVIIGFGLLLLAAFPFPFLRDLGWITATATLFALLADLVVLPALLWTLSLVRPSLAEASDG